MKTNRQSIWTTLAILLAILSLTVTIPAQTRGSQPTKFQWEYKGDEEPGPRYWARKGSTWTERYSSGYNKTYRIVRAETVTYDDDNFKETLHGTIVEITEVNGKPVENPYLIVFIPDIGSSKMWLLIQDGRTWGFLGTMVNVE